jgi:hypothetical protein
VEFRIPGTIKKEIVSFFLPALIGTLDLLGLGFPVFYEKERDIGIGIEPSKYKGFVRVKFYGEDKNLFVEFYNRKALALSDYLVKFLKAKNVVPVKFGEGFIKLSRGETFYKLKVSYKGESQGIKLSKEELVLLLGAIRNVVFGRYRERKIIFNFARGIVVLEEYWKLPNEEENKKFQEKISEIWNNLKDSFPALVIRENLRKKGIEHRDYLRIKVGQKPNDYIL